jgi:hypothetical protein
LTASNVSLLFAWSPSEAIKETQTAHRRALTNLQNFIERADTIHSVESMTMAQFGPTNPRGPDIFYVLRFGEEKRTLVPPFHARRPWRIYRPFPANACRQRTDGSLCKVHRGPVDVVRRIRQVVRGHNKFSPHAKQTVLTHRAVGLLGFHRPRRGSPA